MNLREWALIHVRHKSAYQELQDIKEESDRLLFVYPQDTLVVLVKERLKLPDGEGRRLIVTLQTRENLQELLTNWDAYSRQKDLTITFANPAKNEQWSLKPWLHAKIADKNLAQGIRSMAAGVPYV